MRQKLSDKKTGFDRMHEDCQTLLAQMVTHASHLTQMHDPGKRVALQQIIHAKSQVTDQLIKYLRLIEGEGTAGRGVR